MQYVFAIASNLSRSSQIESNEHKFILGKQIGGGEKNGQTTHGAHRMTIRI